MYQRIPFAAPIETRDGTLSQDSVSTNLLFEVRNDKKEIIKRPGLLNTGTSMTAGKATILWSSLNALWAGVGSNLYKINSALSATSFGSVDPGYPFRIHMAQGMPAIGTFAPTYSAAGTYSFTVPTGVTSLTVVASGAGAGGGGGSGGANLPTNPSPNTNVASAGGGGSAGEYKSTTITVVPGHVLSIVVGAGGVGGTHNYPSVGGDGTNGASTTITDTTSSTVLLTCAGGIKGLGAYASYTAYAPYGTGGAAVAGSGAGGVGEVACVNKFGLGGGSGVPNRVPTAGGSTNGGSVTTYTDASACGGGGGGNTIGIGGKGTNTAGANGSSGGGGSGGGCQKSVTSGGGYNGGNGGDGYVQFSYSTSGIPDGPIMLHNGNTAWYIASGASSKTAISDPDFPAGPLVPGIAYVDGYFVVGTQAGRIYSSAIDDPSSWNALDFLTANADPDNLTGIARHLNYVVGFGSFTTQFFYDNGNTVGSPFSPNLTATIQIGCANGWSIANIDQTTLWVGQTKQQGKSVYMLDGLSPLRISTSWIEKILNADLMTDVSATGMKIAGHTLYILNLHNSDITLVYDLESRVWYNWTSYNGTVEKYFMGFFFTFFNGQGYMIGDDDGILYQVSTGTYQDNGQPIYCKAITQIDDSGSTKRKFYRKLVVVGDKTTGTLDVSHSGTDYQSYSAPRSIDLSVSQPQLHQLGQDRRRSWKFEYSGNDSLRLEAAEITFDIGGMEGQN